jgi:YhcH/YjgK/YiaL family protein
MVVDKLENANLYSCLGEGIAKAFEYLKTTDFSKVEPGKYQIVEGKIFAIVAEYDASNENDFKLEGHRKNIDVQYWVEGSELMGYAPLRNQEVIEDYNDEKDFIFYRAEASFTKLEKGMFAIYFPSDLHTAIVVKNSTKKVKKVVVKVGIK